jgi:predicted metal-dependent peptidase
VNGQIEKHFLEDAKLDWRTLLKQFLGWKAVYWVNFAGNMNQWRGLLMKVINLPGP